MQDDDLPMATTLRTMDHNGKPGEQGDSRRGLLAFVSRVHLIAGFPPDQIGRQYRKMLAQQGATTIERMIPEEKRRPSAEAPLCGVMRPFLNGMDYNV